MSSSITDVDFAEAYADDGMFCLFEHGWRFDSLVDPRSELARFLQANDTLIDSWADFLDILEPLVDRILDGEA